MPDLAALLAERHACAWYRRRRASEHRAARTANHPPRKDPQ